MANATGAIEYLETQLGRSAASIAKDDHLQKCICGLRQKRLASVVRTSMNLHRGSVDEAKAEELVTALMTEHKKHQARMRASTRRRNAGIPSRSGKSVAQRET